MTTSALEHETPLLSILAVRDHLAPHSDLTPFERDVEASIRRNARTGSLDDLAQTLRTWQGIGLQVKWAARGPPAARGRTRSRGAGLDHGDPEYLHR